MKIKKTVSILLAVFMLVSLLPITGMAKNAYTVGTTDESLVTVREILFHEDFNDLTVDSNVVKDQILGDEEYYQLKVGSVSQTVKVGGTDADGYLYLRGTDTYNEATGSTSWTKALFIMSAFENSENPEKSSAGKFTGTYVTEFKWKQTEGETGLDEFFAQSSSDTTFGPKITNVDDGLRYYNGSSHTKTQKIAYSGAWHKVKVVTYMDTQKYDVYVDDRLLVSKASFCHSLSGITSFINIFRVRGASTGICYDDIVIYREAIDRTVWNAEDFSGYSETRDWSSWQNKELNNSTKISANSDWKTDSVDRWDTWLEGMEFYPTGKNSNGIIDCKNDEMKLTKGAVVRLGGYGDVTKVTDGAGVSFTFRAENPAESHGYIFRMREGNAKNIGVSLTLSTGAFMVETAQNQYVPIYQGVQADRDYNFTIWCNRTTGKYTVYIDGKCVASGLTFVRLSDYSFSDMGRIFEVVLSNTITGACYYDNLVFFYDKRDNIAQEAMTALTADGGVTKSILAGTATSGVTFPTIVDGYTGYTLNWTSSDTDAINPQTGAVNYGFTAKNVTLTAEITDSNREYTLKRSINVRVPATLELSARWEGGKSLCSAQVSGNADYSDTKIYLAIYGSDDTLLGVKIGSIESGVELTPETALTADNYTIKAFALDSKLVPKCVNATASFVIE